MDNNRIQEITMLNVNHKPLAALIFLLSVLIIPKIHAQTCVDAIPASTPTSDFDVHNNGTATHIPTGLMWKVCSEGQTWESSDGSCSGDAGKYNWQQALQAPQSAYAGYSDWRLPNAIELTSIIEFKCSSPSINTTIFNNTMVGLFWSSSHDTSNADNAILLKFGDGGIGEMWTAQRDFVLHIRLVRNAEP